jgi:DNA mismatch repair protein MSH6
MERKRSVVKPWDVDETLEELHRRGYYPRASKQDKVHVTRWPHVLRAAVEGKANLAISSFGAALFYLQRNLIDAEVLGMGIVKAYIPPAATAAVTDDSSGQLGEMMAQQTREEAGMDNEAPMQQSGISQNSPHQEVDFGRMEITNSEEQISNMALDGTTLHNLEILANSVDHKVTGSLWQKINFTKTPHGARMLRAWLLRPLFRKADIDRRTDAVQELVSGAGALAMSEVRAILGKIGDLERLLGRIHSMSGTALPGSQGDENAGVHPNDRAVLYEGPTYTKRKVADFSKILNSLRQACQIPEIFADVPLESGMLNKIVKLKDHGGCFPPMSQELDWYFDNFDCEKAAKGDFTFTPGVDEEYDAACECIERVKADLADYKDEICNELSPRHIARSQWKYVGLEPDSKDKYLIELPAGIRVPEDFVVKGKR